MSLAGMISALSALPLAQLRGLDWLEDAPVSFAGAVPSGSRSSSSAPPGNTSGPLNPNLPFPSSPDPPPSQNPLSLMMSQMSKYAMPSSTPLYHNAIKTIATSDDELLPDRPLLPPGSMSGKGRGRGGHSEGRLWAPALLHHPQSQDNGFPWCPFCPAPRVSVGLSPPDGASHRSELPISEAGARPGASLASPLTLLSPQSPQQQGMSFRGQADSWVSAYHWSLEGGNLGEGMQELFRERQGGNTR